MYQKIYNECVLILETNEDVDIQRHFINSSNTEIKQLTIELISTQYEISNNWEEKLKISTPSIFEEENGKLNEHVVESIYSLKLRKVEVMIHVLENELKKGGFDTERMVEILTELKELIDIKNELSTQLYIIITH